MLEAVAKSLAQMFSRAFVGVLLKAVAVSLALFATLFWAVRRVLDSLLTFDWGWLNTALSWLAQAGLVIALMLSLFPVAAFVVGFFLDDVASAVEARHYPDSRPRRRQGILESLWLGLKLFAVIAAFNIALLPLYVFLPGLNVILFLSVNAYLIGREYFELVALRYLAPQQMRALWRRHRGQLFVAGLLIAVSFTIPVVNLAAPLFGTAFMVHMYKRIGR